jgi:hypothetical protein
MQELLKLQVTNTVTIEKENIGQILLGIDARKSDGSIAPIKDLSQIDIGLFLKRTGDNSPTIVFDGHLSDLLEHLYCGSTKLEIVKEQTALGYNVQLDFSQLPYVLYGEDQFIIKFKCKIGDAFDSATIGDSSITLYTNPSPINVSSGLITTFDTIPVGNGKVKFDENIGSNVARVVLATDNVATFDASTNPRVKNSRLFAQGGYNEDFTAQELVAKNQFLMALNPDSPIRNLVHYSNANTLDDVNLEIDYDNQAVNETKILITRIEYNR